MSVTLMSVSHDTVVSNKHEEQTRHYYVNFQQVLLCWLSVVDSLTMPVWLPDYLPLVDSIYIYSVHKLDHRKLLAWKT